MERRSIHVAAVLVLTTLSPVFSASAATVVFSDDLSASTMNAAAPGAPTSTSTNYAVLSTKNAASSTSYNPGLLKIGMTSTTSGLIEAQARFANSPVTLGATGDYVQLQVVFTNTAGILPGSGTSSQNSTINFGLFESGGTSPVTGGVFTNSGLTSTAGSSYDTGYVAEWQGYVGRIAETTSTNGRFITRPKQIGPDTTSESQDLLFNDVGSGAYDDPVGVQFGSGTVSNLSLVTGNQYTYVLKLSFDAGTGFITAQQDLFAGAGTGGANLYTQTGTTGATSTPTLSFDGLSIGYRSAENPGVASAMTITGVEVTTNVAVPEPSVLSAMAIGAIGLLRRRK